VERIRFFTLPNCGDARIVLNRGGKAIRLTKDHKPSDPEEQKRIVELGGVILGGKVGASLAVTRAFGDSELKAWVLADPLITETRLQPQDSHLIIACDGLWDVASDEDVIGVIGTQDSAQQISDKLLKHALGHKTKDNVSVIALIL